MASITLQVVAPHMTDFFHCQHCEQLFQQAGIGARVRQELRQEYPEEFRQQAGRLADWVSDLSHRYGARLRISLVDPQSPKGLALSLRHWVRSYPTFILDGRVALVGWDRERLDEALHTQLDHGPPEIKP